MPRVPSSRSSVNGKGRFKRLWYLCMFGIVFCVIFATLRRVFENPHNDFQNIRRIHTKARTCNGGISYSQSKWFQQRYDAYIFPFWVRDNLKLSRGTLWWWVGLQRVLAWPTDVTAVLEKLGDLGIPFSFPKLAHVPNDQCISCAIVGNSANLRNSKYGENIDQHDVVIRFNRAPTEGFQEDVGKKTTFKLLYPESAVNVSSDTWLTLTPFKPLDVEWLLSALTTGYVSKTYKAVARKISWNVKKITLLHPDFVRYTHENWLDESGVYPSTGLLGISMAFQLCDHVDVYGFGGVRSGRWQHYWEESQPDFLFRFKLFETHNGDVEWDVIRKLHNEGVITMHKGSPSK